MGKIVIRHIYLPSALFQRAANLMLKYFSLANSIPRPWKIIKNQLLMLLIFLWNIHVPLNEVLKFSMSEACSVPCNTQVAFLHHLWIGSCIMVVI